MPQLPTHQFLKNKIPYLDESAAAEKFPPRRITTNRRIYNVEDPFDNPNFIALRPVRLTQQGHNPLFGSFENP